MSWILGIDRVLTADRDKIFTADGDQVFVDAVYFNVQEIAEEIYRELVREEFRPSKNPQKFDASEGFKLHRQFWILGPRIAESETRFDRADNRWEMTVNLAHTPQEGRNSISFGQFQIAADIDTMIERWTKNIRILQDEFEVTTGDPEWIEEGGFWQTPLNLQFMNTRPFGQE